MVASEMMSEMAQGKRPSFIFTCKGRVQLISNENGTGIAIATTREAANVLAASMTTSKGEKVSVVEVGTLQGEILTAHIAMAVANEGADGVHVTDDGESMYYFQAPPIPE